MLFLCFSISLVMKEEASDYLELETIKNLVRKYSQFINFPIYVWSSKVRHLHLQTKCVHTSLIFFLCAHGGFCLQTETVEEPIEEEEAEKEAEKEAAEDEAEVEEEEEDKDKPKTKKVWVLCIYLIFYKRGVAMLPSC